MQGVFKQILKQNNKIIRILTKHTELYPEISGQVDLALYAAIRIEKTLHKFMQSQKQLPATASINDVAVEIVSGQEDALFQTAMQNINSFKSAAYTLERKINVLVNQSEARPLRIDKNTSQRTQKSSHEFSKFIKKQRLAQQQQQSQKSRDGQQSQSNLSDIDASILKLANKINQVIKASGQEGAQQNQSKYERKD